MLTSHEHGNHCGTECVNIENKDKVFPFEIRTIDAYHDDALGTKRGKNQIFVLTDGHKRIAHLGDLGCDLEPDQKELLKNIDILLVPVGGFYTIV